MRDLAGSARGLDNLLYRCGTQGGLVCLGAEHSRQSSRQGWVGGVWWGWGWVVGGRGQRHLFTLCACGSTGSLLSLFCRGLGMAAGQPSRRCNLMPSLPSLPAARTPTSRASPTWRSPRLSTTTSPARARSCRCGSQRGGCLLVGAGLWAGVARRPLVDPHLLLLHMLTRHSMLHLRSPLLPGDLCPLLCTAC